MRSAQRWAMTKPGFDGFAQAHLVGQDDAFGQRTLEGKQRGVHLMRVQVNLRIHQRRSQHIGRARIHPARQHPRDVLGLIEGERG